MIFCIGESLDCVKPLVIQQLFQTPLDFLQVIQDVILASLPNPKAEMCFLASESLDPPFGNSLKKSIEFMVIHTMCGM